MKLTAIVHLKPTVGHRQSLLQTLERANAACNWISEQAWEQRMFARNPLHKLTYYTVRDAFDLTAQLAVCCVAKVVDAYRKDKKTQRASIPVACVDARYISQQCSSCGHVSRSNRPSQSSFRCTACGCVSHADVNAAINIGCRAAISPPYAVCVLGA